MNEHHLEFQFSARYCQSGPVTDSTRQVWFVLHGYGQLARYFIRKFDVLGNHQIAVVAPEGLSRFYLEPVESRAITGNNRVGATWMTAEDRMTDIRNYLTYLDAVHHQVMHHHPDIPVTVLGFSQGAATASRWMIHNPSAANRLILWSGIFPHDMDFEVARARLAEKSLALVYGTKDPLITDQRLAEMTQLTERLGIKPAVTTFPGGHDIHQETLRQFI
jgi:predicted esterase